MLRALETALDAAEDADGVRAVLLCGEGKGFCAGGDVEAWSAMSAADFQVKWVRYGHRVFDRLARLRQPTIAVLSGHALGGGLELAAACDFRVAETQVKLGFPETSIGVVPGWSGTQRAVRRFGAQTVRRMALGGEILLAPGGADARRRRPRRRDGQGVCRSEGLGRKDRRARAARHRGNQADDLSRRRRGKCCLGGSARQRLHRAHRRSEARR